MSILRERLGKKLLEVANNHGSESEPDHEVGDLQDMLIEALEHIPEQDLAAFAENIIEMNEYFTIEMLESE